MTPLTLITLMLLCGIQSSEQLSLLHRQWIGESLAVSSNTKEPVWSESLAVGSRHFLEDIKKMLLDNNNRDIVTSGEISTLREPISFSAACSIHPLGHVL